MQLIVLEETQEEKEELDRDFNRYPQPDDADIEEYNKEWSKNNLKEENGV